MHPTITDRERILSIIIEFVNAENRVVYGGFALDSLLRNLSPQDILYKELDEQSIDIEFYSPTPIDDVVEICRRLAKCGYRYIRGKEAAHCNTFTISVGFVRLCDITLIPITLYTYIPRLITSSTILNRKDLPINAVHPRFALMDMMNMLCDPFNSHWRLDTILQRIALIERTFPAHSTQPITSSTIPNPYSHFIPPPPPPTNTSPYKGVLSDKKDPSFVLLDADFPPLSPKGVVVPPTTTITEPTTEPPPTEPPPTSETTAETPEPPPTSETPTEPPPTSETPTETPPTETPLTETPLTETPTTETPTTETPLTETLPTESIDHSSIHDELINLLRLQKGIVLVGDAAAKYMGVVLDGGVHPGEIHAMAAGGIFYDVLRQIRELIPSIKWKRYASVLEILDERVEGFIPDGSMRVITLFDSRWRVVPSCGISVDGLRVASFTQTMLNARAMQFWSIVYEDIARFQHINRLMDSLLKLRRSKIDESIKNGHGCVFTDHDSVFRDFYLDYIGRPKHLMQVHMERTDERIAICGESEEPWFSFDPSRSKGYVNKQHSFPISDGREKCSID
jgi:hypothetical protein